MSRGTTGAVELYHALRFLQGGEPLGAPLALVVGGLVTDFDSHGSFADVLSMAGLRGLQGEWWTVPRLVGQPTWV